MQCPKCGTDNKTGAKFCISCGSSLGTFCPNCGVSNTGGAKFCISCGYQLGVPVAQPSAAVRPVVVRTGFPPWAWALVGILFGLVLVVGLALNGVFSLKPSSEVAIAPLQPVLESPEASTEVVSEPGYCPETGGVILYWNAGYDCANDTGDPGYRLRYGDGFQDLNTGQFDNQASSIYIPPGWSVRLYENVEKNGASHCFNTSISNFEDFGNFDNRDLPINDNVTSMQVFRDGTCGQDLAAGAEPAPMPEDENLGLNAPAGAACTDQTPCACLPQELKNQLGADGFIDPDVFFDQYIEAAILEGWGNEVALVIFKPEFEKIYKEMEAANLKVHIGLDWIKDGVVDGGTSQTYCAKDIEGVVLGGDLFCEGYVPEGAELLPGSFGVHIAYESTAVFSWCASAQFENVGGVGGGPGDTGQPKDCRDPLVSCPPNSTCVQSKGTGDYYCQENKQSDSSSGSGDGSSSGCTPGCWCEIGGVAGCWQSCAPHCVDP